MPVISNNTHSFDLDGRKVLFDALGSNLYVLNASASVVWECLQKGLDTRQIAENLSNATNAPLDLVYRDVVRILELWERSGLLGSSWPGIKTAAPPEENCSVGERDCTSVAVDEVSDTAKRATSHVYQLAGYRFRLTVDHDLIKLCSGIIGHLRVSHRHANEVLPGLRLHRCSDGWQLCKDGKLTAQCSIRDEIVPMIHASVLATTFQNSNSLAAVHAAAISKESSCVLMPGASGSGKSTLAAALVASGFDYLSDDLALLSHPPIRLLPVPLCIGLKCGSLPALERYIPSLSSLPTYLRADNKRVRYLSPPVDALPGINAEPLSVSAMIFPNYVSGAVTELRSMEKCEALLRMLDAGYDTGRRLNRDWVAGVVAWMRAVPCYEMHYDSLDQAIGLIQEIVN